MTDNALKWAGDARDTIEGMLAPYGGPEYLAGKDFHGEFFSPSTDFALEWFGDWERPLLYNHGLDSEIKTSVVGRIKATPTDKGIWMEAQLEKSHDYYAEIASLVDDGALGLSSGSVGHLVQTDHKSGEIKRWPLIEGSMTPTPANPDARAGYSLKTADAVAHLAIIDTEAPAELVEEPNEIKVTVTADTTEAVKEITTLTDAVKALQEVLTPQALHDAAVTSGAKCAGETDHPPAVGLAIAGKTAETEPVDLEAFRKEIAAAAATAAVKAVQETLG